MTHKITLILGIIYTPCHIYSPLSLSHFLPLCLSLTLSHFLSLFLFFVYSFSNSTQQSKDQIQGGYQSVYQPVNQINQSNQIKSNLINLNMSSSTSAFSPDQLSPSDQLCYVHCTFCDTVLAVHTHPSFYSLIKYLVNSYVLPQLASQP